MDKAIEHLNKARNIVAKMRIKLNERGQNKIVGFMIKTGHKLSLVRDSIRDTTRDAIAIGWNLVPGHESVEKKADTFTDKLPFNNPIKASIRSLLGQKEIILDNDAIDLVRTDQQMIKVEQEFLNELKKDPRFGNEVFTKEFTKKGIPLGGKKEEEGMLAVGKKEISWLLRHVDITAVADVDMNGSATITYSLCDTLDLRPVTGRGDGYNKTTGILGPIWHDFLGAEESNISATWTSKLLFPDDFR